MNMHLQGGVANRDQRPNAGVDVCKQHLDVCLSTTDQRVANEASGWGELIAIFKDVNVDVVVLEATGGYERGLVCALQDAGITVARVNPRQARDFAKSMGVLAKTDQVDARTLRDFADVLARHKDRAKYITAMPDERRQQLAELMTRRRQLVDMRVAENNHLEHAGKRSCAQHHQCAQDAGQAARGHRPGDRRAHRPALQGPARSCSTASRGSGR